MTTKCHCSRPAGDTNLCNTCARELTQALEQIPFLWRELDTVVTRQTVYGARSDGSRGTVRPLPFHVAASDTRIALRVALEAVAAAVIRDTCPSSTEPRVIARWLRGQVTEIRKHDRADQLWAKIMKPVERATWLIDRPADKWYAGPCNNEIPNEGSDPDRGFHECGTELYAATDAPVVECRKCEAQYDVAARRDWLLEAAEEHLANAATIARAVTWLGGEEVTSNRIAMWVKRKRLFAKGHEPYPSGTDPDRTRPLYRVGDIINLLAEAPTTTTRKGDTT